jgi:hypothetical protein
VEQATAELERLERMHRELRERLRRLRAAIEGPRAAATLPRAGEYATVTRPRSDADERPLPMVGADRCDP